MAEDIERLVRWRTTTREQLSFANNLVLSFSVATVGFEISLCQNSDFVLGTNLTRLAFLTSLVASNAAIFVGLTAVLTRLYDFRQTAETIDKERHGDHEAANRLRQNTKCLGEFTWALFKTQLAVFVVSVASLGVAVTPFVLSKVFSGS